MRFLNLKMAVREAAEKLREVNSLEQEYKHALDNENYELASRLFTKIELAQAGYEANYNIVSDLVFSRELDLSMRDLEVIFSIIANTEDTKLSIGDKIKLRWATRNVA